MTELEYLERAEEARGKLYRAALLTLGNQSAAVDAVDEAVYKGYLSYQKLRQPQYLETWLVRILINICRDELRRRKRELAVDELPETAQEAYDSLPLKEAVRRLPAQLRDVIVLRYFTGLTLEETAAALDLPRGTVSTRQRRALALLKLDLTTEEGAS
ncbi:sigma-70 family RNA polymerase sigma factor [uncultured Flavonifractor sp.]|uniref:sigma-70 family RNA polymerase sigma factor n=1 Tax=uncultured Flavonifractor sp. TaxID=1193534 RepID=UPI0026284980|nr:sigma-70 family RNA polymerase sigma factor [uncultured Flavonifractor sp.]